MKSRRSAPAPRRALSLGASRDPLLPFLLNPQSYPHRPRWVRLIQTHASFVFIAPPYVYKVKKPVDFGFLNFATLERRRHFCEREVALNRRLSPGIYLGVVPISQRGGRLAFGRDGRIVDYAVHMRRLSERHFLDRLVARGEVVPGDLDRLVAVLRRFYEAQEPTAAIEAWGRIDRLRISTDENFRQVRPFLGVPAAPARPDRPPATLSRPALEAIRLYTNRFYARHRGLFVARIREGRIRDCHGDLHLEHIHVTPRALHVYDCIEFNDRLRYVDVASDAAFLAMDLDHEGRPDLARQFAAHMAAALRDDGMLALMDFYKCYRAFVRGKVESLHGVTPAAPDGERAASADRARRYFRLALGYAVAGSRPTALVVMGRIASGKSTLARALGAELGCEVVSSDCLRKQMAGYPLYERTSAAARRRLYSKAMTRRTYEALLAAAEARLRAGQHVVLDATFARRAQRDQLGRRLGALGFPWRLIEAHAGDAAVRRRLRARERSAEEVSDARLEDFNALTRLYEPPLEVPRHRRVRVATAGPMTRAVIRALHGLARLQVEEPCPSL
ncbi:MAG: putative family phosphotransferase fused to gluconate kinase family enzyme [Verrucomicrobiota bacterium]